MDTTYRDDESTTKKPKPIIFAPLPLCNKGSKTERATAEPQEHLFSNINELADFLVAELSKNNVI